MFRSINVTKSLLLGQKDFKTINTNRRRSTSVWKIFLNLSKNYIFVNWSIFRTLEPEFQEIWKLVEPVWPSRWMSSDPFYLTWLNLYKSKPILPQVTTFYATFWSKKNFRTPFQASTCMIYKCGVNWNRLLPSLLNILINQLLVSCCSFQE